MEPIDIAIVVVYLGVVAALGVYFSRRQKTTEDYFLAGRNIPGWVVAFSLATAFLSGWDVVSVIVILGAVTVLYTLVGGVQAVVWTDVIQGIFLVGGGLLCVALILFGSDVEATDVISRAWDGGKFEIGRWQWNTTENNQWMFIVGSVFIWLQGFTCNQNNVQRYLIARSDKEAVRGAIMGVAACIPVWLLFMVLGRCVGSSIHSSGAAVDKDCKCIARRIFDNNGHDHYRGNIGPVRLRSAVRLDDDERSLHGNCGLCAVYGLGHADTSQATIQRHTGSGPW